MNVALSTCLTRGIAIVTVAAIAWAPSAAPPTPPSATTHAIALTAATTPYDGPSLFDLIGHGVIIPSLGQAPPMPPPNTPIPVASSANQAIKNIYTTVEPWVRYGFELATYAVGWVPWVGWLSGQIMIFYNFGERIARTITFNVADWLFGPVPFLEGLRNVARDSWNALVQLGIDEWNFFLPPLPPLPPLPFAAKQPANATAQQPAPSQASAPAASGSTGRSGRLAAPAVVNHPAAAAVPRLNRHPKDQQASSQRQATHDNSASKGVGRPKPR